MTDRDLLKKHVVSTFEGLKAERALIESSIWEAYSYMNERVSTGPKFIQEKLLYDTSHIEYLNTMANGIMANLCSPNVRWFKFVVKDSDNYAGINDWLELAESTIYQAFNNSRFYPQSQDAIRDAIIGGTSYEMTSINNGKVVHECLDPQECYISDNVFHEVEVFYRKYTITANQALEFFDKDCPQEIKMIVERGSGYDKVSFLHAIFPESEKFKCKVKTHKFHSVHYCYLTGEIIKIGGYIEFPVAVHRFVSKSNSPYGKGLISDLIVDIKRIQSYCYDESYAIDTMNKPPLFAPETLRGKFKLTPGAINYGDLNKGIPVPFNITTNLQYLHNKIETLKYDLSKRFYVDLFQLVAQNDRQRTMYEVNKIEGRRLMLLSAVIGNIQVEKLNPIVSRVLNLLLINSKIKELPQGLIASQKESEIDLLTIELDGLLAQNLKAYQQNVGLEEGLMALSTVGQLSPETLVNFDFDQIARQFASVKGLPQTCIREKEEVAKLKEAAANKMKQKEMMEVEQARIDNLNKMADSGLLDSGSPAQKASFGGVI